MPRKYVMSWEGPPHFRWSKMYQGRRYRVFCTDLGVPESQWTKESSYLAANQWWENKLAGLIALHPHADRLDELRQFRDASKAVGARRDAEVLDAEIERVNVLPTDADTTLDEFTRQAVRDFEKYGGVSLAGVEPAVLRSFLSREDVYRDRARRTTPTPPERTVGALTDRWLGDRQDEARKGVRSSENADALKRAVYHFRSFVGPSTPAECLTADLWHRWYVHCAGMVARRDANESEGWSADTAAKYFGVTRSFVRWLWERDVLAALPKNLTSKQHRFERPERAIPTFSNAEIGGLLAAARGVHRLLLLLPLNCGMTQKDVADLRKDQVDLDAGRITRRRSKMMKKKAGRVVSYKLWPEVAALLREYTDKDPAQPRALVTKSGQPWVWAATTESGKLRKSDNVATVFNNLKRRVGMERKEPGNRRIEGKSFKVFRKTSATRLKGSEAYRDLRFLFLGHSERTVADRHYAAASQEHLDAAVAWLRTQYDLS